MSLADPDYVDAFEVTARTGDSRSAERWARDALEGAPVVLRWFVLVGWRLILGLRLGPRSSPGYVLGWQMTAAPDGAVLLEARSRLLVGQLVIRPDGARVSWRTLVRYESSLARGVWAVVGVLHRRIVPYALLHAARKGSSV